MKNSSSRVILRAVAAVALFALLRPVTAQGVPPSPSGGSAAARAAVAASDSGWPRPVPAKTDTFYIYQPQLDSWSGNNLEAHFALATLPSGLRDTIFGVGTFTARTDVDKANRVVLLQEMTLTGIKFPTAPAREAGFLSELQAVLPKKSKAISLDRLEAEMLEIGATQKGSALPLDNTPPKIVFSSVPAVLIPIAGKPVIKPLKGTDLERLINTSPVVVRTTNTKNPMIYLHVFDGWLTAKEVAGPWKVATSADVDRETVNDLNLVLRALVDSGDADPLSGAPSNPYTTTALPSLLTLPVPQVIVATTPTELIVTQGMFEWDSIPGTTLRYVKNTSGRVFENLADHKNYILLSGRWFRADSLGGPWQYVAGKDMPKTFSQIPDSSAMENVKAAIPGTPQAQEAVIENMIPQTQTLSRTATKMSPIEFDGMPVEKPIDLTHLQYVVNASRPLIQVAENSWYAVQSGVWFTGASMRGPWTVAPSVPAAIYEIPPSSPLHFVTYVHVYRTTADSINVGYTPGYNGAVLNAESVVVYGTGYNYDPWIGDDWYETPFTYGYGANIGWTPWYGWRYGAGYGYAWGWGGYGLGSYRGAGRWGEADWGMMSGNVYDRWNASGPRPKLYGGVDPALGNPWADRSSLAFNSRWGWPAAGSFGAVGNVYGDISMNSVGPGGLVADPNYVVNPYLYYGGYYPGAYGYYGGAYGYNNNVYGDRNGNVFRRNDNGWGEYGGGGWRNAPVASAGALNRASGARSMGAQRYGGFQSAGGARARSGGMARGGGGGRRR
jgi:hypothetical protein